MQLIYRNRKAVALFLLAALISGIAIEHISDYWADYFANLAANCRLQFTNDRQQHETQLDTPCNVRIEEGPNGTTSMFVFPSVTVGIEVQTSGSVFDCSTYTKHILMWEAQRKTYELIRDVSRMFTDTVMLIFCFLGLSQLDIFKRRKFLLAAPRAELSSYICSKLIVQFN